MADLPGYDNWLLTDDADDYARIRRLEHDDCDAAHDRAVDDKLTGDGQR